MYRHGAVARAGPKYGCPGRRPGVVVGDTHLQAANGLVERCAGGRLVGVICRHRGGERKLDGTRVTRSARRARYTPLVGCRAELGRGAVQGDSRRVGDEVYGRVGSHRSDCLGRAAVVRQWPQLIAQTRACVVIACTDGGTVKTAAVAADVVALVIPGPVDQAATAVEDVPPAQTVPLPSLSPLSTTAPRPLLPEKVELAMVRLPWPETSPLSTPPPSVALLPEKVEVVTVVVPDPSWPRCRWPRRKSRC